MTIISLLFHYCGNPIMTFRTLLLENALMSFMAALLGHLSMQGSLECLLQILFERSGARMETASYGLSHTSLHANYDIAARHP